MPDNTLLNLGTGGDIISSDIITTLNGGAVATGEKAQRVKVGFGSDGIFRDVDSTNPLPVLLATDADNIASGTLTAALQTVVLNTAGKSSAVFKVTNTWAGTITFEGSVDGTQWDSINAVASSTSSPQPTTTVNGSYRLTPAAFLQIRAIMTLWTSGTATISARASSATGGIFANQILPSKITNGTDTAGIEPFGALQINNGFQTLFYDSWSTALDTVDKWTVTGNTPTIANGNMTMSATLSSYNAIRTKDTVRANVGFSLVRNGVQIETAVATGAGRFWGLGTPATVPAASVLAQDGIGYEIDQATGALLAVTYAVGVRTTIATLTAPTDGLNHAYGCYFRVTQAYWILDGVTVATKTFPNVQVVELPVLIVRQNAAAFTGTPAFVNIAHLTADTSRQGFLISDPIIGTRQMRVDANGAGRSSLAAAVTSPVTILQNAVSVTGNGASLTVTGYGTGILQVGGTFVGTISFETFNSVNSTWVPISATQIGAGDIFSVATVPGVYRMTVAGLDFIRARVTLVSGTITINGWATNAINASKIMKLATGGLVIGKVYLTDGTNSVGITSSNIAGNETLLDRAKVNASLRLFDTAQAVGAQLVAAKGDQTTGLWVAVKSSVLPTGAAQDGTDITTPFAMPTGGLGIRGWLSSIWTKLNGSLAVTGSFFQATQPVSIASMPSTPVTGTFFQATQPVSGTFFQATQPVSLGTNTPTLAAGTNSVGNINELRAASLAVTVTAAVGTAATLTLPAVAGQFHYITAIDIVLYSSAARTGAAAPTVVTSTNLPGAIAFTFSTAGAIGTTDVQDLIRVTPLKSSTVNTATTIVAPIAAGGIWRITATYFTGA